MGWYLTLTLFKGCTEEQLRTAVGMRVAEVNGKVLWNSDEGVGLMLAIRSAGDVHTVSFDYRGGVYGFFKPIGSRLQCPWMEIRVQDGHHWDYSLMRGDEDLDEFSTHPQYFCGEDDTEHQDLYRGDPDVLSSVWSIPHERIVKYLANWGSGDAWLEDGTTLECDPESGRINKFPGIWVQKFKLSGKAYLEDESEYGNCEQVFDFIRALGGNDPCPQLSNDSNKWLPAPETQYHRLVFPDDDDIYGPQPMRAADCTSGLHLIDRVRRWLHHKPETQ